MAVDSQTSATTPAAAPAQPHDGPGADASPSGGATTPSPGAGASTASPAAAGGSASPSAAATASPATAPSTAATTPGDPAAPDPEAHAEEPHAGFGSRGRLRRRARFLRKARELAYRDLGGLVFSLHRFGQRNDALVLAKLSTLSRIDAELRTLEDSLGERQPVTVLREAGITACPRCAAIHSGEDRFCPSCGLSMSRRSDLPIATAAAGGPVQPPAPSPPGAPTPAPAPAAARPPGAPPSPASTAPATEQHAAVIPASGSHAQPHAAPQPATQAFDAVPPAGDGGAGRSPAPPPSGPSQPAAPAGKDDDQPTEIIRPPAPGS